MIRTLSQRMLRRRGPRTAAGAALLLIACVVPFLASGYRTFEITSVLVYGVSLLGLVIVLGRAGVLSLAQAAFFAVGAYATAIPMARWSFPFPAALVVGALVALVFGVIVAIPSVRLSAIGVSILTLSAVVGLTPVIIRFEGFTGGRGGLVVEKAGPLPGLDGDQSLYFICLVVLLVMLIVTWSLLQGRLGRAWDAIRDNEIAAAAMGVNVPLYKGAAIAISALYGGVAGGLFATVNQFVAPESFGLLQSFEWVVALIVGGVASLGGAVVGGVFVVYAPRWIDDYVPGGLNRSLVYGVVLIAIMWALPRGLAPALWPALTRLVNRARSARASGWSGSARKRTAPAGDTDATDGLDVTPTIKPS